MNVKLFHGVTQAWCSHYLYERRERLTVKWFHFDGFRILCRWRGRYGNADISPVGRCEISIGVRSEDFETVDSVFKVVEDVFGDFSVVEYSGLWLP